MEYSADTHGVLNSARTNEVFDITQNPPVLMSYLQTDYLYDAGAGSNPPSHGWLAQITNSFHRRSAD